MQDATRLTRRDTRLSTRLRIWPWVHAHPSARRDSASDRTDVHTRTSHVSFSIPPQAQRAQPQAHLTVARVIARIAHTICDGPLEKLKLEPYPAGARRSTITLGATVPAAASCSCGQRMYPPPLQPAAAAVLDSRVDQAHAEALTTLLLRAAQSSAQRHAERTDAPTRAHTC